MEGQVERSQTFEKNQERQQNFVRSERASVDVSTDLRVAMESEKVPVESQLKVSLYVRSELAVEMADMGRDELLKLAKDRGWRVAIYNPGVAWTGDQWANREVRDNPRFRKKPFSEVLESWISREEKTEQSVKAAALDFLAEGGFDLAITFDPFEAKGFVSNLRADMMARRETIKKVGEALGNGKLEVVSWSNGGYKEFQVHRAVAEVIATGKGDALGIFKSVDEAEEYAGLFGKYQIDVFLGGAPANEEELATPFKLTSENAGVKTINEAGMKLINWLIKSAGGLPNKYIPEKLRLLGSRVIEMGRGQRVNNIEANNLEQLQQKMKDLLGGARILSLADTSGSVVASDRQFVGDDLRAIYGDKVIMVETHDNKPLPKTEFGGSVISEGISPAQHGELKRYGVIGEMRRIIEEKRRGTFNKARNEQTRFVVVEPEARVYGQTKGTRLRLNPLPQLGHPFE